MFQSTTVVHHNILIKVFLATFRKPLCLNQLFLLDVDTEGMKIRATQIIVEARSQLSLE